MNNPQSPDRRAKILGIDYVLPSNRVTNDMLDKLHPAWQMEQVALRTGVLERRWCAPGETALDLAVTACRKVIDRVGPKPNEIDAILFCTQSPDYIMPPNACLLQSKLGLGTEIAAFDFSLACSGYIYGLYIAKALIESGQARNVLLATAETYSKHMNPDDRGPITLFGDGAAATLLGLGESGLESVVVGTDGRGAETFMIPAGGARLPLSGETRVAKEDPSGNLRSAEDIYMNGGEVLDFVKRDIPGMIRSVLKREGCDFQDIDLAVFHQASKVTLDFLNRALHIPPEKQFSNIALVGNTVSASIPIALRDAELQGVLTSGMRVVIAGFGVGLSWGGCVLTW